MRIPLVLLLATSVACLAREIPAGTTLQIRLTAPLSSTSSAGQPISAVLIAAVMSGSEVLLNAGATISGTVKDVIVGDDKTRAQVTPEFTVLRDAAGHEVKLAAKLTAVDNARETVSAQGQIVGIDPGQTLSTRLDQGLGRIADRYSTFAGLLGAAKNVVVKKTDASINYPAGVEMALTLTEPLNWTAPVQPLALAAIKPAAELQTLVDSEPFRTYTDKSNKPSDITNLMFLGTPDQVRAAFEGAGWSSSASLSGTSKFRTFQAMAENRGYTEAPMSVLTLDGRPPDLALEKANNTFASRHHLRIWLRPETWHGKAVWVCSSTHDTGIGFSDKERTFIHQIDSEIDRERAKVVNDLVFTGKVTGLALIARDGVPASAVNGTGDAIHTDGAMAVIEF